MANRKIKRKGHRLDAVTAAADDGPDIYQRLTKVLLGIFVLFLLGLAVSYFMPEVRRQKHTGEELDALRVERDSYRRQRDKIAAHLERLQTNTEYFELFARDRLDLRGPGETIYRIDETTDEARAVPHAE